MQKNKYQIITLSISALVILVSIIGYTYSYFSANVKEVNKTETIVKTNELNITYTGGQEINAEGMIPGDSFTKTFSVENTSSKAVTFNIYMENIINEFNEDLVYTLSDEEEILLNNRILPRTNERKTYLRANIQIEANTTKNYTLTILYKYLSDVLQENQGATFSATVGIDSAQNITTDSKGILMRASYGNPKAFWEHRENITEIVFENTLLPKENAAYSYDVSEGQDKSVMSYLVANEDDASTYTLYLQGEGSIKANEISMDLFYNFIKLTTMENLEYLDTSNVISMRDMFWKCENLISINLTEFDTSKVTDMHGMFSGCKKIQALDLSNFNTSNVTDMYGMFSNCSSLTNLDLSNFDTSKVTTMSVMFYNCKSLNNLDLSNFNLTSVENMNGIFVLLPNTAVVKVKDEYTQNKILSLAGSNRPSSWTTDNVVVVS